MGISWITLYPRWYAQEVNLLGKHYPRFRIDDRKLQEGQLVLYGKLIVRPPGGPQVHPIQLAYPDGTPYEHPSVIPLESQPCWAKDGGLEEPVKPKMLDHRHQMPAGNLCLFQRETRSIVGGDILSAIDILKRAEDYFFGYHTGHWPPDTVDSELESHFAPLSDALMAELFYTDEIRGFGRFFFVPDLRRLRDVESRRYCPIIITALTNESTIIRNFEARSELSRLYPWIEDRAWDCYTHLISESSVEESLSHPLQYGYWWALPREPRPFHNGKGLLQALSTTTDDDLDQAWHILSKRLGAELTTSDSHLIGLRYPARRGGLEWLILFVARDPRRIGGGLLLSNDASKRADFEDSSVAACRVHRLNREVLIQRNTGVVGQIISNQTVALIGLGALGSKVAELLAQAGVGRFRLCDSDRLRTGNVARHIAGITDFGAPKVKAVASRLLAINPYLEFGPESLVMDSAVKSLDKLSKFIVPADLVICATADESVESVVNQITIIKRKCVLYGRSLRRGSIGRVFLVRPGKDACKACLAHYAMKGRQGGQTPVDWIDIPEEPDEVLYHECARPVIATSAVDISFTASLIARIALSYLEGKDLTHNHWIWSQHINGDIDARLNREMATVTGSIPRYEQCWACMEPEIVELVLTEEVKTEIIREAEGSQHVETGGVLIGHVDNKGRALVLRCTGPGPNAAHTKTEFHRDVLYVQSELDKAARELGEDGLYIGEWHSHLAKELQPSPIDIKSLFEISEAANYLTRCPVMLIAAVDKERTQKTALGSWAFPTSRRMYSIPIKTCGRN